MAEIYVTSDTHFGDDNIIRFEVRPYADTDEMNEKLIELWNETVSDEDTVFHLGDVGVLEFKKMQAIISRLKGNKILIMGNHDDYLTSDEWRACGFNEVCRYPIIYNEFIVMQHEPPQYINDAIPFFYLYGHVHGTKMYPDVSTQSACVCVERWDYKPVNIEEIKRKISK